MTKARDLGDNAQNTKPKVVDAKGDLIVGTGSDAANRLAAGSNGDTLVADSSATTGLRWQGSIAAAKNALINGNADFWQRGTTFTATTNGAYNADRWLSAFTFSGGTCDVTRDTSVPNVRSLYSIKYAHATANTTSLTEYCVRQKIEAENAMILLGRTITLSFWYRSNKTGNHAYRLFTSNVTNGGDAGGSFTVSVADTWEYKTITITTLASATAYTGSANGTAVTIDIGFKTFGGGTITSLTTGDYFQITQVQLEPGSVATNFTRAGGTLAGELAACQRYYQRIGGNTAYEGICPGIGTSGNLTRYFVPLKVTMRTTPSSIETNALAAWDTATVVASTGATISTAECGPNFLSFYLSHSSGITQFRPYFLIANNSTSAYLGINAEL